MTEDERMNILAAKHQWVITDPYPDITEYQMFRKIWPWFKKKPTVSAHKAWRDGFQFAWSLIEKRVEAIQTRAGSAMGGKQ